MSVSNLFAELHHAFCSLLSLLTVLTVTPANHEFDGFARRHHRSEESYD